MAGPVRITGESIVEEVLTRFPATASVFVQRRMHCIGCQIARFETVAEACRTYDLPLDAVLAELHQAAPAPSPRFGKRSSGRA